MGHSGLTETTSGACGTGGKGNNASPTPEELTKRKGTDSLDFVGELLQSSDFDHINILEYYFIKDENNGN